MTDDPTAADRTPRRRPSAMTMLAAGSLGGLLLGFGGVAFAADEPASTTPPSATTPEDGAVDDELCEPGSRGPAAPDSSSSATPESSATSDDV